MTSLPEFLAPFFPDEDEPLHLRAFKAKGAPESPDNRPVLETVTRRRLAAERGLQNRLSAANSTRGWYFVVNSGGNTDADITRFNAVFVENDQLPIEEQHRRLDVLLLQPSIRVETRKSVHAYWLLEGSCSPDEWREVQECLIHRFDGDKSIKNPSRVMRLPHFNHVHWSGEAYEHVPVKITHFNPATRYTLAQVRAEFLAESSEDVAGSPELISFEYHEDRHAELCRRIEARGKRNSKGNVDAQARCHSGKGQTGLVLFASGAVHCNAGCEYARILEAEGLSSERLPLRKGGDKASAKVKDEAPLRFVRMSDVEPQEVSWLWYPYIPSAKLTVLDGEEGIGKSWLLCAIAARISRGELLPFCREALQGNVLLLSGTEDGIGDTIRPRLDRVGADCTRIYAVDEPFTLDEKGVLKLAELIAEIEPVLVIIDPLFDYITARTDINRDNESRAATKPLRELAERFGCAIIAARHIGKAKGNGEARAAGLGGIGFRAAGRSNLLVGCDPQDRAKRAMILTKSNLADMSQAKSVGFTIEGSQFYWLGESQLTAEQVLSRLEGQEEREEKNEAIAFLREALQSGKQPSEDIKREATKHGLSEKRLRTARTHLKVRIEREGFGPGSKVFWSLPSIDAGEDSIPAIDAHENYSGKYEPYGDERASMEDSREVFTI